MSSPNLCELNNYTERPRAFPERFLIRSSEGLSQELLLGSCTRPHTYRIRVPSPKVQRSCNLLRGPLRRYFASYLQRSLYGDLLSFTEGPLRKDLARAPQGFLSRDLALNSMITAKQIL